MKHLNTQIFGIFGAMLTILAIGKADSALANGQSPNIDGQDKNTLADKLIQKNLFQMDSQTNEVQIDNEALVESLREELLQKIKQQPMTQEQQVKYQFLLNNLKPGNYQRFHEGAKNLQSMDFGKGG